MLQHQRREANLNFTPSGNRSERSRRPSSSGAAADRLMEGGGRSFVLFVIGRKPALRTRGKFLRKFGVLFTDRPPEPTSIVSGPAAPAWATEWRGEVATRWRAPLRWATVNEKRFEIGWFESLSRRKNFSRFFRCNVHCCISTAALAKSHIEKHQKRAAGCARIFSRKSPEVVFLLYTPPVWPSAIRSNVTSSAVWRARP